MSSRNMMEVCRPGYGYRDEDQSNDMNVGGYVPDNYVSGRAARAWAKRQFDMRMRNKPPRRKTLLRF